MRFLVIYEKSVSGWGAFAPDLPGCGVAAHTLEETKKLIKEAIEFHIEGMRHNGEQLPEGNALTDYVTVQ